MAQAAAELSYISFLLTHPLRDVTFAYGATSSYTILFLLTHPLRDVTLAFSSVHLWIPKFLLTHPLRDVTNRNFKSFPEHVNFYSHTPCGM